MKLIALRRNDSECSDGSEPEVPSDWEGDPDDYWAQIYDRPPPPNQTYPFLNETHSFGVISHAWLHYCFGFLELKDLLRLSVLSKRWSKEVDDGSFWSQRYVHDLGEERYKASLFLNTTNGWTAKEHLTWSLVVAATPEQEAVKFEQQRNVWCGIMRERKRKYYEQQKEEEEEVKEAKEAEAKGSSTQKSKHGGLGAT